jgi:hypothetical protein
MKNGPGDMRVILVDLPEVFEGVVDIVDLVGGGCGDRGRWRLVAGRAGGVSGGVPAASSHRMTSISY